MSGQFKTDELHDDAKSEKSYDPECETKSDKSYDPEWETPGDKSYYSDNYPREDVSLTTSDVIRMTLQIAEAMDEKFERVQKQTCAAYDQRISDMEAQFKELQESLCSGYERRILETQEVCKKLQRNQFMLMDRIAVLEESNNVMRIEYEIMKRTLNKNFENLSLFKRRLPIKMVQDLKDMLQDYQSKRLDTHLERGHLERGISNGVSMLSLVSPPPVVMLLEDMKKQKSIPEEYVALPGSDAVELPLDVYLVPIIWRPLLQNLQSMLQDCHNIKLDSLFRRGFSIDISMLPLISPRRVVSMLPLEDVKEQESIAEELVALYRSDAMEPPLNVSLVPFSAAFFHDNGKKDLDETLGDLGERLENIGEHIEDIGERLQVVRNNLDRCSSYFFNVYVFTMCPHQKDIPDTIMNNIKYWAPFYVFLFLFLLVVNPQKMCRIMDKNFGPALDYAGQLVVPVFEFFCERLMYIWDWLFREYFAVGLS